MSSSLGKFYEVMKRLDEAISDVERIKGQIKDELDSYVTHLEEELRNQLEAEIKRMIEEYRANAELSIKREVDEYLSRNRAVIERIRANRGRVVDEAVNRILKEMGFSG